MICTLKHVIVFTKNYKKNELWFKSGLNIISGVSQTGKSAIIEIVDYCLASTSCSIPKGTIEDNSILYSIILELKESYLIIGRRPVSWSNKEERGKSRMFFKVESKEEFDSNKIEYLYFEKNKACYRTLDDVKKEIETFFGVSVYKRIEVDGIDNDKSERVSIRSIASFLFQHQNLVANKFALFYRFDDSFKMKKTIAEFPIFLGIVDQEYYNILQSKEKYEKELRKIKREKKSDEEYNKDIISRIEIEIHEYYNLISKSISKDRINNILVGKEFLDKLIIEDLNTKDSIYQYKILEDELKEINSEMYKLENKVANIDSTLRIGEYTEKVINDVDKPDDEKLNNNLSHCPLCNSEIHELTNKIQRIKDAKITLGNSLKSISVIKSEYLLEEKNSIENNLKEYDKERNLLIAKMRTIKKKNKIIEEGLDLRELIIEKRIRIEEDIKKINVFKQEKYDSKIRRKFSCQIWGVDLIG